MSFLGWFGDVGLRCVWGNLKIDTCIFFFFFKKMMHHMVMSYHTTTGATPFRLAGWPTSRR